MLKGFMHRIKKDSRRGKLIVGVCSTHAGAGATHFSMLLATYFSEWLGRKTAYIDFNDLEGFNHLKQYFFKNKEEQSSHFTVGRINFFNCDNLYRISEIIGGEMDCVILNIGHQFLENRNEFLRCDIKIVVSSLAIWKQDKLQGFIETVNNSYPKTDWKYVIPFVDEKALKEGVGKYRINLCQMPYQPDPFTIHTAVIRFFDRLLQ